MLYLFFSLGSFSARLPHEEPPGLIHLGVLPAPRNPLERFFCSILREGRYGKSMTVLFISNVQFVSRLETVGFRGSRKVGSLPKTPVGYSASTD